MALELGEVLTIPQTRTLHSIAEETPELAWLAHLASLARGQRSSNASSSTARAAMEGLALPPGLIDATLRHVASETPVGAEVLADFRQVLLWLTSGILAVSFRTEHCLAVNFLTLFLLSPGFLRDAHGPSWISRVRPSSEQRSKKENVS